MNRIYSCKTPWGFGSKADVLIAIIFMILAVGKSNGQVSAESQNSPVRLMIFAPDVREENYRKQLLNLSKNPIELDQRNIMILEIFPAGGLEPDGSAMEEDKAKTLRKEYHVGDREFRIIVLDSGGTVLLNSVKTVENPELFKLLEK